MRSVCAVGKIWLGVRYFYFFVYILACVTRLVTVRSPLASLTVSRRGFETVHRETFKHCAERVLNITQRGLSYSCRKSAFSPGRHSANAGSPLSVWGAFLQMQETCPVQRQRSSFCGCLPCTKVAFLIIRKHALHTRSFSCRARRYLPNKSE